ncbi:hypothetical protein LZ30DRAFT_689486 [Colletotrichum cereale]|nr:hypothetical protein LZ30DRAFT_689486 [Colletotrichum cereale]
MHALATLYTSKPSGGSPPSRECDGVIGISNKIGRGWASKATRHPWESMFLALNKGLALVPTPLSQGSAASTLCDSATSCPVPSPRATQLLSPVSNPSRHGCTLPADLEPSPSPNSSHPSAIVFDVKTIDSFTVSKPQQAKRTNDNKYGFRQVERFVDSIPRDEPGWQAERQRAALTDVEGILRAFSDIMSLGHHLEIASTPRVSGYILHRATEAANCPYRHLYEFGALIFIGECSVALQLGEDAEVVNEAMRKVLCPSQTKATNSTLRKYRDVPARVCGHRAFEMFIYGRMSVSQYDKVLAPAVSDALYEQVCKIPAFATTESVKAETQAQFPFYLPFLIWAGFRLRLNVDCFDGLSKVFDMILFEKSQFESWLRLYTDRRPNTTGFVLHADGRANAVPGGIASHKRPLHDYPMPQRKRMALDGGHASPLRDCTALAAHQSDSAQVGGSTLPAPSSEGISCSTPFEPTPWMDDTNHCFYNSPGRLDEPPQQPPQRAVYVTHPYLHCHTNSTVLGPSRSFDVAVTSTQQTSIPTTVFLPSGFGAPSRLDNSIPPDMDLPDNQPFFVLDEHAPASSVVVGVDESTLHSGWIDTGWGTDLGLQMCTTDQVATVERSLEY